MAEFGLSGSAVRALVIKCDILLILEYLEPDVTRIFSRSGRFPRRSLPVRLQAHSADCGAACLSMTLSYHGVNVSLERLREATETGRDGVSARVLLETARRFGLTGRGVRVSLAGLRNLPPGSILFWRSSHFVVFEKCTKKHIYIIDPAMGRRRLDCESAQHLFTGVALAFTSPMRSVQLRGEGGEADSSDGVPAPWRLLVQFVPRRRSWALLMATSLLLLAYSFATPWVFSVAIDDTRSVGRSDDLPTYAALVIFLSASYFCLHYLRSAAILRFRAATDKKLTDGVFSHLMSLPYQFFAWRSPSDLAQRIRTSAVVRRVITDSVVSSVFDGALTLISLVLLSVADYRIAVLLILLCVLQVGVVVAAWKRQSYLHADALERRTQAESQLHELLENIATLKSAGLEAALGERWRRSFADEVEYGDRSRHHLAMVTSISIGIQFSAPLFVLLVAMNRVAEGDMSVGKAVCLAAFSAGLFASLTKLVEACLQLTALRGPLTRLADVFGAAPEVRSEESVEAAGELGDIELVDVHFGYPGAADVTLKGVSLKICEGSVFCVVGKSGSGKSTLAMVLAGLIDPSHGERLIGGTRLNAAAASPGRNSIAFINQDSRVFSGSIRENIAMGFPDATDEAVCAAAKAALVHDEIMAMPMKYETSLRPGGAGISGGQRQRITLARALITRPRYLIMDEATSALDQKTEEELFSSLRSVGCTLVIITHRLSAVREADTIAVFDQGRVDAIGSHEHLIGCSDLYKSLYEAGLSAG